MSRQSRYKVQRIRVRGGRRWQDRWRPLIFAAVEPYSRLHGQQGLIPSGMDARFGPEHRLHDGRDYSRVFHRQQKAAGRHVVVLVRPRSTKEPPHGRLGVMVATKTVALAVRRHQLKRWVRDVFRRELKAAALGYDVVVLLRSDPPPDGHAVLDAEIRHLLPKAMQSVAQPGPRRHAGRGGR